MSKYVHDTAAAKKISAHVILRKDGTEVASVQGHHGARVLVNVRNYGQDNPSAQDEATRFQSSSAGGYGYDKYTAALSGMVIDGHKLSNHCGVRVELPEGKTRFPADYKPEPGYRLANWCSANEDEPEGYMSCYRLEGLRYLEAIGYRVIQAI
jgi:hypothetical protein